MKKWVLVFLVFTLFLTACGNDDDVQTDEDFLAELKELAEDLPEPEPDFQVPVFEVKDQNLVMYQNGNSKMTFVGDAYTENFNYIKAYFVIKTSGAPEGIPDVKSLTLRPIDSTGEAIDMMDIKLYTSYEDTIEKEKYYIYTTTLDLPPTNSIVRFDYEKDGESKTLSLNPEQDSLIKIGGFEEFPIDVVQLNEPISVQGNEFSLNILGYRTSSNYDGPQEETIDFSVIADKDATVKINLEWPGIAESANNTTDTVFKGIERKISATVPMNMRFTKYNSIIKIRAVLEGEEPTTIYFDLVQRKIVEERYPPIIIHEGPFREVYE